MRALGALILVVVLAGCAQQSLPLREANPTDVPFAAMVQTKHRPIQAAQVLSGDDADQFTAAGPTAAPTGRWWYGRCRLTTHLHMMRNVYPRSCRGRGSVTGCCGSRPSLSRSRRE